MKLEFELPENVPKHQAIRHFGHLFADQLETEELHLFDLQSLLDDTKSLNEKTIRDLELSVRCTKERIALYKVVLETMRKGEFK